MLKAIYSSADEIPEGFKDLYEERDGQLQLTKIEGIKTDADVHRVQSALEKERNDRKKLQESWNSFFGDKKPEDIQAQLDKIPELEAAADGKVDEEKLNQIADSRVKSKTAPLERELNNTKTELQKAQETIQQYQAKETQRTIHDAVREAGSKAKVLDSAMEDALMLAERVFEVSEDGKVVAKEGVGVTPGVTPDVWLSEMQQKRPHWWPASQGAGAKGSGAQGFANNPWSAAGWNMTKQGQIVREQGMEKAQQMAKSAGSYVGAAKPPAK
jgi:hypothetical protein